MNIEFPKNIIKGTFSVPKNKDNKYKKATITKINDLYQITLYSDKQAFHSNYKNDEIENRISELLQNDFNNLELFTNDYVYGYRITSKGKLLNNKRLNQQLINVDNNHNRKKNYILEDGIFVPALFELGIMTEDGKVTKAGYNKFRQINRFLEIIDDSIKDEELNIIDFGCGKSYLTFILYHFLVKIKNIKCNILGLDLKEDVIDNCNKIAKKYNYDNLIFKKGDIADFKDSSFNMIITLHACDTATDYALYHAINMKCKYIFSVPCCQHEINESIKQDKLHLVNKFGILKERFSAILTDAIRANILQYEGYKVNVMEFVDIENTPKNLLIRAIYNGNKNVNIKNEIDALLKEYNINQKLYDLLFNKKDGIN